MVKKWTILDQKWPNMAGFSTLQSGPKGSKMVNLTAIDHLGSFWAHLGASEPFQTKTDFFLGLSECWPFQVFESAPMSRNQYEFGKEQYAFCPLRLMLNHKSQSLIGGGSVSPNFRNPFEYGMVWTRLKHFFYFNLNLLHSRSFGKN